MSLSRRLVLLGVLALAIAGCGGGDTADTTTSGASDTTTSGASDTTSPGGSAASTTSSAAPQGTMAAPVSNGDDVADDGETVAVHYTGTLDDGSEFDSSIGGEPFEFQIGAEQVIAGFDAAVRGMAIGDVSTVRIEAEDAYGVPEPEAVAELPIDEVPEEFREEGLQVTLGNGFPATIVEVTEQTVTIDANHPLAGEALTFEIELVEILS